MTRIWTPAEGDVVENEDQKWEVKNVDWGARMVEFEREGRGNIRTSVASARRKQLRGNLTLTKRGGK